ncbi:MAG: ferredoxin oxidoreductase [Dethiobacteria bacterium]|jgi:2-oxoglutarate ferredoxin oxidoreductase subunit alpha
MPVKSVEQSSQQSGSVIEERRAFMYGNEVVVWAALAAGAKYLFGYPITPQNEIMHYWARLAPDYGGGFLQTEDELSAGFATLGGIMAGVRSFSATAGPGTVLFQEPLSMAEMMRLPMVLIVQQRGGPSTATVIYSQQEVFLSVFGGNGEGLRVVYSPGSHQEMYDYTIKAFLTAWKYRFPTLVLGDGYQAQMREPVELYDPNSRGIEPVPSPSFVVSGGVPGLDREPAHWRNAFSIEEELYDALMPIIAEFQSIAPDLAESEQAHLDGAELVLIGHGIVGRTVKAAACNLRERGYRVGYFRPLTLRPFPEEELKRILRDCPQALIAESAQGQLAKLIRIAIGGDLEQKVKMYPYFRPGLGITAEEITGEAIAILEGRQGAEIQEYML